MQLRLSDAELEALRERAAERGVSIQRMLVDAALKGGAGARGKVAVEAAGGVTKSEVAELRTQVARVGSNVNQLTRYAHQEHELRMLDEMWTETCAAMRAIERVMNQLVKR